MSGNILFFVLVFFKILDGFWYNFGSIFALFGGFLSSTNIAFLRAALLGSRGALFNDFQCFGNYFWIFGDDLGVIFG